MAWAIIEEELMQREKFVLVVKSDTIWEAAWLKGVLVSSRIQAMDLATGLPNYAQRGEVWVPAEKRDLAIQILKELAASELVPDDWHEELNP